MVDKSGKIYIEPAGPHPTGTYFLEEAINEHVGMRHALRLGVPTAYSIGIGEFTDMRFNDKPTGFTIMAIERKEDSRLGDVVVKLFAKASQSKRNTAGLLGRAFNALREGGQAAARTLRRLHIAGGDPSAKSGQARLISSSLRARVTRGTGLDKTRDRAVLKYSALVS